MDSKHLIDLNRRHTLFTWTRQRDLAPPLVVSAERCHYTTADGQRVLDLASGVFNANAGLHHPRIAAAIAAQAQQLCVAAPYMATEVRARAAEQLAAVVPAGLDHFLFTLGGADAVEHALKMARLVTGRQKVVARRRAYHGATLGALSATGDERRDPFEPWLGSIVRLEDPYCYRCPWDTTPDVCALPCADSIETVLQRERPESIAAVLVEAVVGTNGGFTTPTGWMQRLRELCTKHGILLIADEVLTGFGRTGRWFGFEHSGVVPDMVVLGKAITSGHAPLGAVAVSRRVADHFDDQLLATGTTHTAHPIALAAARATVEVLRDERLVECAAQLEPLLRDRLRQIAARSESIGDVRVIGAYGVLEFVKNRTSKVPLVAARTPAEPRDPLRQLAARLQRAGVHVAVRWNNLYVAPPLCISENELLEGLAQLGEAVASLGS